MIRQVYSWFAGHRAWAIGSFAILLCIPPTVKSQTPGKEVAAGRQAVLEVRKELDIAYYDGPDADPVKHKLDLYLPQDQKDFPVVFFVHGGAWRHGDKSSFLGLYGYLASSLARHGLGVVVPNYRLSPGVTHPEHIRDIARAFAWTYRNIGKYGGRSDEIFVSGHSAGGHLVALLATDENQLKAQGLTLKAIRGAIPLSGIFRIEETGHMYDAMFGTDADRRRNASPVCHACADAPPFLIIYADGDLTMCAREPAESFCAALKEHHAKASSMEVKDRNHATLLIKAASDGDPVNQAIRDFVAKHAATKMTKSDAPMASTASSTSSPR
jgi:acetyl esterase/lipase